MLTDIEPSENGFEAPLKPEFEVIGYLFKFVVKKAAAMHLLNRRGTEGYSGGADEVGSRAWPFPKGDLHLLVILHWTCAYMGIETWPSALLVTSESIKTGLVRLRKRSKSPTARDLVLSHLGGQTDTKWQAGSQGGK